MNAYLLTILILICVWTIFSISLNLAIGFTGLLNLGHVAFFGIGAYTSALLTLHGYPFWISFILAGILPAICGLFLSLATNKVKGDYLALATLGFNFVIFSLMLNLTSLTRGPLGLPGIPKPEIFGIVMRSNLSYLIFCFIFCVASILIMKRIVDSPYGRLMQGTRDDELGLRVLGKNTLKVKTKIMMVSAFFAGLAGSLFAHYITYIDPSSFGLSELIFVLTIVILGGLGSIKGSVVGTIVLVLIPEILRFVPMPSYYIGPVRQIIYSIIIIVILLYRPKGIFGKVNLQ